MQEYRYLLVGGGMAAAAAIDGIRRHDPEGSIGLVTLDRHPPYSRPPLSKGLWKGKRLETIWRYADPRPLGVTEYLAAEAAALQPTEHVVELADGRTLGYRKLLIATGVAPRRLPGDLDGVLYFRDLDDYLQLFRAARKERFLVVGGGFIGAELAAALRGQNKEVHLVFPEDGILARLLPQDLSRAVTEYYRTQGVEVHARETIAAIEAKGEGRRSILAGGGAIEADLVVAGVGVRPRTELAEAAGLQVDDGIVVDAKGRTSAADVYAAGDVARFPAPVLHRSLRVEHENNAVDRGRLAGENMAGADREAEDLPFFYSDLFDLGFEAVGVLDSRLEVFADWAEPYRRGVLYYLDEGRVVGVLDWNVWDALPKAQALLGEGPFPDPTVLRGRIATT
ncbi:MAG: FAD-dependent oxidoreductase [Thermaerobacter sp.]|nr:FAD-dependent oxidoreductase [Thermaerobacter sp.]